MLASIFSTMTMNAGIASKWATQDVCIEVIDFQYCYYHSLSWLQHTVFKYTVTERAYLGGGGEGGGNKTNTNYKQNLNCGRSIEQWCYDEYDNDYECDVLALLHWLRLVLFLNSKIFFIFAEISFFPWKKYWKMPSLCLTRGYICKLKQYKQLKRVMVGLLFLLVVSILHVLCDE